MDDVIKDIRRVLSSLAVIAPFSYPMLMMPIEIRPDLPGWAGTNGITFYCNPNKWNSLSFKEKMFVAMHEWIHVVMQHAKRLQGRRRKIWGSAADFVVNDIIISDLREHFTPPKSILYDYKFSNKNVEQVYNLLLESIDEKKKNNKPNKCNYCNKEFGSGDSLAKEGEGSCGVCGRAAEGLVPPQFIDSDNATNILMVEDNMPPWGNDLYQTPSSVNDQQLIDAIIKAAARAKGMKRGRVPGRYEEYVETLKMSVIPWERLLYRFAKKALKGTADRNPYKPDPKYLPFDMIIPTEESKKISKLVFIIDTSASMDKEDFEYACGQIQRLGTLVNKCIVIMADTQVQEVIKVKKIKNELKNKKIKFKGRGGTNMISAFKEAEKHNPDLIILYSDLIIADSIKDWPERPKRTQCIFLATENSPIEEVPYGILIKMRKK